MVLIPATSVPALHVLLALAAQRPSRLEPAEGQEVVPMVQG